MADMITGLDGYEPILVRWRDAETYGGPEWVESEDVNTYVKKEGPIMTTIGFLLYECPGESGHICMTDTYGDSETSSIHKIPNGMVLSRTGLLSGNTIEWNS